MRVIHFSIFAALAIFVVSDILADYPTPTVTVDAAKLSGTATLPLGLSTRVRMKGNELRFAITNDSARSQKTTVKVTGLESNEYDCYVNGSYRGKYNKGALAAGIPTTVGGGVVDLRDRQLLELFIAVVQPAADNMMSSPLSSPYATEFRDAALWMRWIFGEDKRARTELYSLIEAGLAPTPIDLSAYERQKDPKLGWPELISDLERLRHVLQESTMIGPEKKAQYQGFIMPIAVSVSADSKVKIENYYTQAVHGKLVISNPNTTKPMVFSLAAGKSQVFPAAGITLTSGVRGVLSGKSSFFTFQRSVDTNAEADTILKIKNGTALPASEYSTRD